MSSKRERDDSNGPPAFVPDAGGRFGDRVLHILKKLDDPVSRTQISSVSRALAASSDEKRDSVVASATAYDAVLKKLRVSEKTRENCFQSAVEYNLQRKYASNAQGEDLLEGQPPAWFQSLVVVGGGWKAFARPSLARKDDEFLRCVVDVALKIDETNRTDLCAELGLDLLHPRKFLDNAEARNVDALRQLCVRHPVLFTHVKTQRGPEDEHDALVNRLVESSDELKARLESES